MIPTYYAGGERPLTPDDISQSEAKIIEQIIIKSPTIPTASAEELGKVRMFTGETGAVYTHGYIYECVEDTVYDGLIGFDPAKIGFDYTQGNLIEFLETLTPNYPQVAEGVFKYDISGDIWTINGVDSEGVTVFDNYRLYSQDLRDAGFVFLNPSEDYADGEEIGYYLTLTATPVYSWERVDVQPVTDLTSLENRVTAIEDVVPAQATAQNQLADKAFVNSSISTNTANFIGTFNSVADLEAYTGTVTNNDYAFVTSTDAAGNTLYNRYKYNGTAWVFEYALNNSGFTASQWAAINSGATAAAITAMQTTSNLVTSISNSSTDTQYPSAKCVYDIVGNIETVLQGI